uniref:MYND-type domain-containing protein n=1 Tax=Gouania willdenowi TaxID=441366 RepID=A0A8C5DKE1_GOUWI
MEAQELKEIFPLTFSKGNKKLCELCQRPAHLQCNQCQVTYYCGVKHQQTDWVGIHQRICQFLVPLHAKTAFGLQKLSQQELIEICKCEVQIKLSERKHLEALPAAHLCLRYSKEVYGPNTMELVPVYLLLAEANMGLGNLSLVREFLSQAELVVSENPDCGHGVHQQLCRNLGHLHALSGHLDAALHYFANDVYHSSEEYGLDSTCTCTGLFLLADVFDKQGNTAVVRSMYSEVAQVWHRLLQTQIQNPDTVSDSSYDKAQRVEQEKMLMSMLEFERKDSRTNPAQTAVVAHCLAMLAFLGEDDQKVSRLLQRCLLIALAFK